MAKVRSRPRMSPSLAPASMNAAITSVYAVMASCTPPIVVLRSATIWEIDTFMTLLSSTITNCAAANTAIGSPSPPVCSPRAAAAVVMPRPGASGEQLGLLGAELLVRQRAAVMKVGELLELGHRIGCRGLLRRCLLRGRRLGGRLL